MFLIFGTVAAVLVSVLQVLLFNKKETVGKYIHIFAKNEIIINLVSLFLLKKVFHYQHFLVTADYGMSSFLKYMALAFAVGIVYVLIQQFIYGKLAFEKTELKKTHGARFMRVFSILLVFLGTAFYTGTNWSSSAFGDVSGDQLIINLMSPASGAETSVYVEVFEIPVFLTLFVTSLFAMVVYANFKITLKNGDKIKTIFNDFWKRLICFVLSIAVLAAGFAYFYDGLKIRDVYYSYVLKSNMIEEVFEDPEEMNITFPEQKRNLIYIYLESVENSYLSKELGGYMDTNLMPELTELSYEGIGFSDNDTKFGGPQQATGTQWSIASVINQTTGMPMKTPDGPNTYGQKDNFLPGAYTLFDLLADQGYEQTIMMGADAGYGGFKYYFQSHGDVKIFDYNYAKETGLIPQDYEVWWGFEDDKLYEFAKDEITRLYETGKPFHFSVENADTHRPHGYLSPNAPTPYDDQYANVIAYSSSEVVKFVRWIQEQPFYDNTTVVLIGDHLSMDTDFFKGWDENYFRSQFNLILNPVQDISKLDNSLLTNRQYANFDMFPTVLTAMGVSYDGSRLGMGTDLLSGEKTIIEEYGLDYVNDELMKKSEYYNEKILQGNTVPRSHRSAAQWAEYDKKKAAEEASTTQAGN